MKKAYIVGAGPGDPALLTGRAAELITRCGEVFATRRIAEQLAPLRADIRVCEFSGLAGAAVASGAECVALLVSGDTGFFSAASGLARALEGAAETETVAGVSSLQYLYARLGVGYEDVDVLSLHGREGSLLARVAYNPRVFALTGGSRKAHDLCRELAERGPACLRVTAGENLSMPGERIVTGTAEELTRMTFGDLTVLLVENPDSVPHDAPLADADFERGQVPMTKQEVRWVALAKLGIRPADVVYDIGAGTGSVAIEAARKAYRSTVHAVEREEDAARLTETNRARLGAWNVVLHRGEAPGALAPLPAPDRVFIGGSGGSLHGIVDAVLAKNPQAVLAVTAISLETLGEALGVFESAGIEADVVCVNAARARRAGGHRLMTANNPVYIISGGKA